MPQPVVSIIVVVVFVLSSSHAENRGQNDWTAFSFSSDFERGIPTNSNSREARRPTEPVFDDEVEDFSEEIERPPEKFSEMNVTVVSDDAESIAGFQSEELFRVSKSFMEGRPEAISRVSRPLIKTLAAPSTTTQRPSTRLEETAKTTRKIQTFTSKGILNKSKSSAFKKVEGKSFSMDFKKWRPKSSLSPPKRSFNSTKTKIGTNINRRDDASYVQPSTSIVPAPVTTTVDTSSNSILFAPQPIQQQLTFLASPQAAPQQMTFATRFIQASPAAFNVVNPQAQTFASVPVQTTQQLAPPVNMVQALPVQQFSAPMVQTQQFAPMTVAQFAGSGAAVAAAPVFQTVPVAQVSQSPVVQAIPVQIQSANPIAFRQTTTQLVPNMKSALFASSPALSSLPFSQLPFGRSLESALRTVPVAIRSKTAQTASYFTPAVPKRTRTVFTQSQMVPTRTTVYSTTHYSPAIRTTVLDTDHVPVYGGESVSEETATRQEQEQEQEKSVSKYVSAASYYR